MLQNIELSDSQDRLEHFVNFNTSQTVEINAPSMPTPTCGPKNKKLDKKGPKSNASVRKHSQRRAKIMIVTGDSMLVRDFIINYLKPKYKLTMQVISANTKRNSNTFRSQIFEGSQCNATYKMNFFGSAKPAVQPSESSILGKFFARANPIAD